MAKMSHRLVELRIVGGFLDGFKFNFSEKLNCIIGARGTGKTTVLELLRYGLDAMPRDEKMKKSLLSLVESNLKGGRVEIVIETGDGLSYIISREFGGEVYVYEPDRQGSGMAYSPNLFPVDVFSQNEIEEIAGKNAGQMELIESFSKGELDELNSNIRQIRKMLEANATQIFPLREREAQLTEALSLLPSVKKRLDSFAVAETGDAKIINAAHEQKSIRNMEVTFVESAGQVYHEVAGRLRAHKNVFEELLRWRKNEELSGGENYDLVQRIYNEVVANDERLNSTLTAFFVELNASLHRLNDLKAELLKRHQEQDMKYRELIEKGRAEQENAAERRKVADQYTQLIANQSVLLEVRAKIDAALAQRSKMQSALTTAQDRRFQIRYDIAERINRRLAPNIRVTMKQFGSFDVYFELLVDALKGTPMQYRQVSQLLSRQVAPPRLAELIRKRDVEDLRSRVPLNENQAKLVISTLNNPAFLSALEIVELPDTAKIELNDHGTYKTTETLSTGQKCNAILPILLLDSDRPLLIDQPEDNLDNEFVHNIIVKSVRDVKEKRQMIFVTHNPNIPVLGEAEKILVMESDGTTGRIRNAGTVDDCKSDIVSILEGGEDAFKKRKERYAY